MHTRAEYFFSKFKCVSPPVYRAKKNYFTPLIATMHIHNCFASLAFIHKLKRVIFVCVFLKVAFSDKSLNFQVPFSQWSLTFHKLSPSAFTFRVEYNYIITNCHPNWPLKADIMAHFVKMKLSNTGFWPKTLYFGQKIAKMHNNCFAPLHDTWKMFRPTPLKERDLNNAIFVHVIVIEQRKIGAQGNFFNVAAILLNPHLRRILIG